MKRIHWTMLGLTLALVFILACASADETAPAAPVAPAPAEPCNGRRRARYAAACLAPAACGSSRRGPSRAGDGGADGRRAGGTADPEGVFGSPYPGYDGYAGLWRFAQDSAAGQLEVG